MITKKKMILFFFFGGGGDVEIVVARSCRSEKCEGIKRRKKRFRMINVCVFDLIVRKCGTMCSRVMASLTLSNLGELFKIVKNDELISNDLLCMMGCELGIALFL
jgi:hypothetical protein